MPYDYLHSTVQLENYSQKKAAMIENDTILNNQKELNDKFQLETGNIFGDDILPKFPGEGVHQ